MHHNIPLYGVTPRHTMRCRKIRLDPNGLCILFSVALWPWRLQSCECLTSHVIVALSLTSLTQSIRSVTTRQYTCMKHCIASFFRLRHPGALHHELLTLPVEDPGRICNLDHGACLKKKTCISTSCTTLQRTHGCECCNLLGNTGRLDIPDESVWEIGKTYRWHQINKYVGHHIHVWKSPTIGKHLLCTWKKKRRLVTWM